MEFRFAKGCMEIQFRWFDLYFANPLYYRRLYSFICFQGYEKLGWWRISLSFGKYWLPRIMAHRHRLDGG